jgi:hypothetical protein
VSESPVKARPVTGCATKIKNIIGAPLAVQLCATPLKNNSSCTLLHWPGAVLVSQGWNEHHINLRGDVRLGISYS